MVHCVRKSVGKLEYDAAKLRVETAEGHFVRPGHHKCETLQRQSGEPGGRKFGIVKVTAGRFRGSFKNGPGQRSGQETI